MNACKQDCIKAVGGEIENESQLFPFRQQGGERQQWCQENIRNEEQGTT